MSQVIVNLFNGLPTLVLSLPESATVSTLKDLLSTRLPVPLPSAAQRITTLGGRLTDDDTPVFSKHDTTAENSHPPIFNLLLRLPGGKGGFGSMLRAQGGKMAAHKTTNFDACRDLSGRRLKTVNDAKKLADYLAEEPQRKRKRQEEITRKIEEGLKEREKQKIRFYDPEYMENHEKVLDDVGATIEKALQANGSVKKSLKPSPEKATAVAAVAAVELSSWDEVISDQDMDDDEDESSEDESSDEEEDGSKGDEEAGGSSAHSSDEGGDGSEKDDEEKSEGSSGSS
ncbi:hypothetical protein HK104_003941 [Borealophlyctis nickersoniae]|nr:hypothetical protein HK104_003941 [Borealophlyctis nickersoniae]